MWPMLERRKGGATRAMARGWCSTGDCWAPPGCREHRRHGVRAASLFSLLVLGDRLKKRRTTDQSRRNGGPHASSRGRNPHHFFSLCRGQSAQTAPPVQVSPICFMTVFVRLLSPSPVGWHRLCGTLGSPVQATATRSSGRRVPARGTHGVQGDMGHRGASQTPRPSLLRQAAIPRRKGGMLC